MEPYIRQRMQLFSQGLNFPKRKKLVIFDLDGTVFDISHRVHHIAKHCGKCGGMGETAEQIVFIGLVITECDFCHGKGKTTKRYDKFFAECHLDVPVPVIVEWLDELKEDHIIFLLTGRDIEKCGKETWDCLQDHEIPFDYLIMKAPDDSRKDDVIKSEVIDAILKTLPFDRIAFAVDDRGQVIRMMRARGIKVYPVRCVDVDFE